MSDIETNQESISDLDDFDEIISDNQEIIFDEIYSDNDDILFEDVETRIRKEREKKNILDNYIEEIKIKKELDQINDDYILATELQEVEKINSDIKYQNHLVTELKSQVEKIYSGIKYQNPKQHIFDFKQFMKDNTFILKLIYYKNYNNIKSIDFNSMYGFILWHNHQFIVNNKKEIINIKQYLFEIIGLSYDESLVIYNYGIKHKYILYIFKNITFDTFFKYN
jgi:hypothetical protein